MKTALAIFAKTAELSPVKTRLAADIGEENAKAFYALSVKAVEAVAKAASLGNAKLFPHWCIGEETGVTYPQWQSLPAIWTGDGGLGERLATISEILFATHDMVMFIGTDSPQILPDVLNKAQQALQSNASKFIAGPALDGGFYLFGSNQPVPRNFWEAVEYSVDTTLEDLIARLEANGENVELLPAEQDVDTLADLPTLKHALENKKPELLTAQVELLNWLKKQAV